MAQTNKANKKQAKQQQQSKKSVQEKSTQQKQRRAAQSADQQKKCTSCRWLMGSLLLVFLLGVAIAVDTEYNGRGVFAKSATGKVLQNAGVLPHVEKAWYTTMSASARGYKWAELHVPPYARPVIKLACDLYKLGRNVACNAYGAASDAVKAKLPVVADFLEQYVPGLPEKIKNASEVIVTQVGNVWQAMKSFFSTQVFVGRFSPENLNQMFNKTQIAAIRYYKLFHNKVDAYAKLK